MTRGDPTTIRLLVPRQGDACHVGRLLQEAGMTVGACPDLEQLLAGLAEEAGALVVDQEALDDTRLLRLIAALEQQPHWSALPVVVLTREQRLSRQGARLLNALESVRGVVFLARPLRGISLISLLRNALAGRRRQYQVRDLLLETQAAVEQRDRFLALLGHELRNPLAPLRSLVDALRLQPTPELLDDSLDLMDRQVSQLTHLVDDLLDVARISQGRIELRLEALSLQQVIEQAVTAVRPLLDNHGHRLTLDLPREPLWVEGDQTRLVQVITNLLNNAARYTSDRGHVKLAAGSRDGQAVLRVRDDGIGIAAEDQPRIFEALTRLDNGRSHNQQGLGLGLSLVQQLVQLHRGSVSVHSDGLDEGSEFTVALPLLNGGGSTRDADRPAGPDRTWSILVVDDNREGADALALLLRSLGHQVAVAYGGQAALDCTEQSCPAVVLLDLNMPQPDGYQVASRLHRRWGRSTRLIAITGHARPQQLEEAGFERHLLKPVALDELRRVLGMTPGPGR